MTRIGPVASLAFFVSLGVAAPAGAQSGTFASSGGSVSNVVASPAPVGRFEAGNFPVPGLSRWSGSGGSGGFSRFERDRSDRHDQRWRGRRRGGGYAYGYGYGIGIGGAGDPERGYFADGGDARKGRDGQVDYDYDRGYPYDHYSPREERELAYEAAPRERYCETVWARGGRSDDRVPVTVCRN